MRFILPMIAASLPFLLLLMPGFGDGLARGETPPKPTNPPPGFPPEQAGKAAIACPPSSEHGEGAITGLCFSPDGKTLAAGNAEGMVKYFDPATARLRSAFRAQEPFYGSIVSLAYSPDGMTLTVAPGGRGTVALLEPATGRARLSLESPSSKRYSMPYALAYSPDGQFLATGYDSGEVALWDASTCRRRTVLPAHIIPEHKSGPFQRVTLAQPAGVLTLVFSPDSKTLITQAVCAPLRFWDVATGVERSGPIKVDRAGPVALSPDGQTLAVSDGTQESDESVSINTIWNMATGRKRVEFPTEKHLTGLAFLPGGRTLVALEGDQVIRLWDAETGRPKAGLRFEHRCKIGTLAVSPDGKLIALGEVRGGDVGFIQLIETDGETLRSWKPQL